MKKLIISLLFFILGFPTVAHGQSVQYVVIEQNKSDSLLIINRAAQWKLTSRSYQYGVHVFTVKVNDYRPWILDSLKRGILQADSTNAVRYAELDESTSLNEADGDYSESFMLASWGLDSSRVNTAWEITQGEGVYAAIMDTGFDPSHPEFENRIMECRGFDHNSSPVGCGQVVSSCNWHGQHTASTVGGKTRGMAPKVKLYLFNVFTNSNGCASWNSQQIAALEYMRLNLPHVKVVNISIGGGFNGAMSGAVKYAREAGIIMVASAGNNTSSVMCPGCYDDVFAIAALTNTLTRASYSNQGPQNNFTAPGSNINGAIGASSYGNKSGTSMASPHIAGTVALMLSVKPNMTFTETDSLLRLAAKDLGAVGFDNAYGWGFPRADRAVALAAGMDLQPTTQNGRLTFSNSLPYPQTRCADVESPAAWSIAGVPSWASVSLTRTQVCVILQSSRPVSETVLSLVEVK